VIAAVAYNNTSAYFDGFARTELGGCDGLGVGGLPPGSLTYAHVSGVRPKRCAAEAVG
jgi:hypothetical protein